MPKRVLTDTLKMKGYKTVELYQEGTEVKGNGNFSLPEVIQSFKTPEEAKAFIQGVVWAVNYYDGDVAHYMKEVGK